MLEATEKAADELRETLKALREDHDLAGKGSAAQQEELSRVVEAIGALRDAAQFMRKALLEGPGHEFGAGLALARLKDWPMTQRR